MLARHRSWYSWAVSSAADSVYALGFVRLCPQLYINYKLRSVAHLPLRAFGYKVFCTFIDDVFAFMVEMPLKHRLMTFRDDLVFLAFLAQWYWYPTDKKRVNEFGYAYEDDDAAAAPTGDGARAALPGCEPPSDDSPSDDPAKET